MILHNRTNQQYQVLFANCKYELFDIFQALWDRKNSVMFFMGKHYAKYNGKGRSWFWQQDNPGIRSFFIVQINHLELHYYLSFVSRYSRKRNKFFGHNFSNGFLGWQRLNMYLYCNISLSDIVSYISKYLTNYLRSNMEENKVQSILFI